MKKQLKYWLSSLLDTGRYKNYGLKEQKIWSGGVITGLQSKYKGYRI